MKTFFRRFLTMLLAAAMVFGLSGMTAFAAEAEESGIVPLTEKSTNDIDIIKNGFVIDTISETEFATAVAAAPEQTLYPSSGRTREVTAHFVKVSELLGNENQPDDGCGVLVTGNTSLAFKEEDGRYDGLYLYDASADEYGNYGIRAAVDGAAAGDWIQNVTSITLGHNFNAKGICTICGAEESSSETYNVKYAVTLWGIEQDHDKYNNALGLTFGPATGADYTSDYKSHMTVEEYESGENGVCLHWMSWEEIAEQSKDNPTVFQDCLENGCTHSVNLTLNPTLLATTYEGKMNAGDGAGVLNDSIAGTYRRYDSSGDASGGWPASFVRATLNGKDKQTKDNDTTVLGASECLLSCFPSELQSAIVRKAVTSDTVYDSEEAGDATTTYDKLWLPSGSEAYQAGSSDNEVIRANEGTASQRSEMLDITTTNASALTGYDETGSATDFRLRSISQLASNYVYLIGDTGSWRTGTAIAYADVGLAPCFCLAGRQNGINDSFYDVKYAVTLWGINADTYSCDDGKTADTAGLTFGPATGADYRDDYNAHLTEEEYASGENGVCLHWMSWDEIAKQSETDPTVFEECLKNGCTHAVNLALNDTILDVTYADEMEYGDGVGYLYHSIQPDYREWNRSRSNDEDKPLADGWPESMARKVLNEYKPTDDDTIDPSEVEDVSLLTCFPDALQAAIVPKEVKSDTVRTDIEGSNETTYDKLWYFSAIEMWGPCGDDYYDGFLRPLEGSLYARSADLGITTTNAGGLHAYNEEASEGHYWYTRSLNCDSQGNGVVTVLDTGLKQGYAENNTNTGLAPGFCLAGPEPGDKTALEKKVAEVEAAMEDMDPDEYTPASWEALEEALANAQEVLAKEVAYQVWIDAALEELTDAYDGLAKPAGDKTALEKEVTEVEEEMESLNPEDYTPASWEALKDALANAQAVLADENATQAEVNTAQLELKTAMDNLEAVPADKETLKEETAAAKDLTESDYTANSWAALQEALKAAEEVNANDNALQSEVEAAEEALKTAMDNLEAVPADKETLKEEIAAAEDKAESDYTADSWAAFQNALKAAEEVNADPDALQSEVKAAEEALKTAMGNLEKKTDDSGNGGNKLNGLNKVNGVWGYYTDGKVDTSYTGFAHNDYGDWYVVNGYVYFDQNTVAKDTTGKTGDKGVGDKGTWWYVTGSKVQHDFTGLANYRNANGWWYIVKGKVDFTHNGVEKNKNGWWYVNGGKVQFGHNGVDKNQYGWWYITGGKVQFGYTGVANYKNANGWWYIQNGKVNFNANTVAKNKNGWWYVTGGKVQFGYTGVANYKNAYGWWYVSGGKVNFNFNGVASNAYGTWYLRGGKVQFGYSGTVRVGSRTYTVRNGKVS